MKADDFRKAASIVQIAENQGAEIRDVEIDFVESEGVLGNLSKAMTGNSVRKPVFTIEFEMSGYQIEDAEKPESSDVRTENS